MKRFCILILLFWGKTLFAQQPAFVKDSLELYIQKGMNVYEIPAIAVAIVKDGKVVHVKGYGTKSITSKEAVDENTLFMIGSNTKLFTGTALALLEYNKKISLDDKVQKWLPYFGLKDALAGSHVIIKDLLSHRIGFETFQGDFTYWCSKLSTEEVVKKMALVDAPYDFRTKYGYCNAAFVAAGEVVKAAAGEKWEDYVRKNMLLPLKMNSTTMLSEEFKQAKQIAYPHTLINEKLVEIEIPMLDNLAPAGSIASSAKDMANWLLTQIDAGVFEGKQAIPQEVIMATRRPQTISGNLNLREKQFSHFSLYGLGIQISDRSGRVMFTHTGGVDGFTSSVAFIPEEKLGVVVLTNTDHNSFFSILSRQIVDAYLDLPYSNYSDSNLRAYKNQLSTHKANSDSLRAVVAKNNKPSVPLQNFTGNYANELYGDISIVIENKKLVIHFSNHPNLTAQLDYLTDNTFLCDFSIPMYGTALTFPFTVENGRVKSFVLTTNRSLEFTPYRFVKKE